MPTHEPDFVFERDGIRTLVQAKSSSAHWRFSLQELQNRLAHGRVWGLAQSLGDIVDVLAFLCVLRVEEQEEAERRAVAEFNGTESVLEFPEKARWELLKSIEPEQFAWHIQEGLLPAFREMPAGSPLRLLPRLFDPSRFSPAAYQAALEMLSSPALPFERYLELERGDKSMALEDKAADLFSGWKGVGEFITPSRVADLMIDLAAPQPGERIYNPCTGFGTLLVRAAKRFILPSLRELSPADARRIMTSTFFGIELNPSICLVALARLMLAGITRPRLELGDVLERPTPDSTHNGGFDVILCNPPFGSAAAPEQRSRYPIQSRSAETLILQHILSHLRPGGRAVVLMPEAFLYRQGPEELLRKRLLNEFRLEAVLALSAGSIQGLGELRTSLLLVHRQEPTRNVVFIPAKTTQEILWGYKPGEGKNEMLQKVLAFGRRKANDDARDKEIKEVLLGSRGERLAVHCENVDTLAARRWELVSKSRGVDKLQILLDTIQRTEAKTKILRLSSVGSVSSGMSYRRTDMAGDSPASEEDVRLIRVRDLSTLRGSDSLKLVATPTMARMTAEGARRAAHHTRLQRGDILLTVTGTVGKVAVVGEGGPKFIAGSGVDVIRVTDAALASYLPRLLTTEPYQDWLWQRSFGTTVSRLRVVDVEHIPVPLFTGGVAPEAIRHVSVGQSLDAMVRLLESKPGFSSSVRFLLEDPLVRNLGDEVSEGRRFSLTDKGVRSLLPRLDEVLRDGSIDEGIEPLHDWLRSFRDFAARLIDVLDLPVGPERFSSLQAWKLALDNEAGDFQKARGELRNRAPRRLKSSESQRVIHTVQERSEALLEALIEVWQADCDDHLNNTRLSATLTPALVTVGVATEISVGVTNEGALPLRNLVFETRPYESRAECNLLRIGESHHWPVKVLGRESGKQTLFVRWTGRRMDESEAGGDIELAFEVASLRTAALFETDIGENPYVYRRLPEGEYEQMFFGREAEIDRVLDALDRSSASTILLVEGNRGIGKTWLLKHLIDHRLPAGWIPVFMDFQDFEGESGTTAREGIPTRNIYLGMSRELIKAARAALASLDLPGVGAVPPVTDLEFSSFLDQRAPILISAEQPWTTFKTLFSRIRDALAPRRLLLLLEEFDRIQNGIDSKITSDQVPENLRSLFQHQGDVAGIFTGSRTIRRLRKEYWNILFSLGEPVTLRGLAPDEARMLIEKPVSGRLVYAEEAVLKIIEVTARQPLLIQGICKRIFALCKRRKQASVTLELVDEVVAEKTADNEHFETLWGYILPERRRCVLFIIDELTSQDVAVTFNVLRIAIEEKGIRYPRRELEADLKYLAESDVIGVDRHDRQEFYRLEVPMFAVWLQRNKDFNQTLAAVQEELP